MLSKLNQVRLAGSSALRGYGHRMLASAAATEPLDEFRGENRRELNIEVGDKLHGYEVKSRTKVPEYGVTVFQLEHERTGTRHMHVDGPDTNNAFNVTLRTPVENSNGVPHILEHMSLCGSRDYPVRDPFFNMLKRSLNTFMNAMTASDYTMYVFSTQNRKDYQNLLNVYTDAVFFPKLDHMDFQQEGHTLFFDEAAGGDLRFKGIVFNEMKGAMSDTGRLFYYAMRESLYSGTPYEFNSGGNPLDIPGLSWEYLRNFHQKHYHPSNAYFCTYGDLPLEEHLKLINDRVLSKFSKGTAAAPMPNVPRITEAKSVRKICPLDPMTEDPSKDVKYGVGFLCGEITNLFDQFSMSILSSLLLDGPNAPLYKNLLGSHIGKSWAPGTGYDPSYKESCFVVGLQGISEEDTDQVHQVIMDTLSQVVREGFDAERIESVLHQIELTKRHVSESFGMDVAMETVPVWIHGGDPVATLQVDGHVSRIRQEIAKGGFFERLIQENILGNKHRVMLTMVPDAEYNDKETAREMEMLEAISGGLSEEDKRAISDQNTELERRQEEAQDLSVLPTLAISDVSKNFVLPEIKYSNLDFGVPVQTSIQPTNGICYVRFLVDLPEMDPSHSIGLSLFSSSVTSVGAGEYNYEELSQKLTLNTGGVSIKPSIMSYPNESGKVDKKMVIKVSFLEKNAETAMDLLAAIFNSPRFNDSARLKTIISQSESTMGSSLAQSGHSYAALYASASFSEEGKAKEQLSGVTQMKFVKSVATDLEGSLASVQDTLEALGKRLLVRDNMKCSIVTGDKYMDKTQAAVNKFLARIPAKGEPISVPGHKLDSGLSYSPRTVFDYKLPVNYCCSVVPSVHFNHPDYVATSLLAKVMTNNYLHKEIREKGGAYGGGLSNSGGRLVFYSYRDPNSAATFQTFEDSADWAAAGSFADEDVDHAKLGIFGDVDAPRSPSDKGHHGFGSLISDDDWHTFRERLFDTTKDDMVRVAGQLLASTKGSWSKAMVGGLDSSQESTFSSSNGWEVLRND